MNAHELSRIAQAMVAKGKGILAADESFGTIEKRFKSINVPNTEPNRRAYRDMLFTTPGIGEYVSGVILFDETIRQKSESGTPFAEVLKRQDILPGIKVDAGAKELAEYRKLGATFTKWRAVITIGKDIPTRFCIDANAHALARYATLSQEAGLVPIVEPEVLMDGDHTIERCEQVTEPTLPSVFFPLEAPRASLEGMVLKHNMVISGNKCPKQAGVD